MKNVVADRIATWQDTRSISASNPQPERSTKFYLRKDVDPRYVFRAHGCTVVTVENIDAVDCGLRDKAVVLNLANATFPGGGVSHGCGAQEESIFRRSNYHLTLTSDMYPLGRGEAIFSPGVTIFKRSEADGWRRIPPNQLNFIACPGILEPILTSDGRFNAVDENIMRDKVDVIMQAAYLMRQDMLVMGALGCGAWKGPAEHTAEIFAAAIKKWDGIFGKVVFAVMFNEREQANADGNNGRDKANFDTFKRVLR
jgi:uncharacterized protein (TIGR02452 family)